MAEVSEDAIDSLVSKIEGLDLSDGELAVLDAVLTEPGRDQPRRAIPLTIHRTAR